MCQEHKNNSIKEVVKRVFTSSFSLRLSLYILLATTSIFLLAFIVAYRTARQQVENEIVDHAQVALDNTILQISTILHEVETTVASTSLLVEEHLSIPEEVGDIPRKLLEENQHIIGSTIAFEPNFYTDKGVYFAPYAYREGADITTKQLGSEEYPYHTMAWYAAAKSDGVARWCEPYNDRGGAEMLITTYSYPLRDATGEVYAILTADISIERFAEEVKAIRPYPDAYNFMISRHGAFLAHSRHEALLNETIFDNAKRFKEAKLTELAIRMTNLERGVCLYNRDNTEYYVLYAPVQNTGWSIAVVCPYVNIFSGIYDLRNTIIAIFVLGITLIVILSYFTIRRLTHPLNRLTKSAEEIASGNFEMTTPKVNSRDEMRRLRDAFEDMRMSLITYIDELRTTTALKERMESDLRIAREIQLGMLPKDSEITTTGIDIASRLIPAREVGGDLYNFFVRDGKLYFIVGDVSGKGVPAALLMSVICRMFRSIAQADITPAAIMSMLNNTLAEGNDSNMFCTAFIGILDIASGTMTYCNAGHNPPMIYGESHKAKMIAADSNIPLGVISNFDFSNEELHIERGAKLFVYTDGITEAMNTSNELYGDERLINILNNNTQLSSQQVAETILEDILSFSRGCIQNDDITLLCIELKSRGNE